MAAKTKISREEQQQRELFEAVGRAAKAAGVCLEQCQNFLMAGLFLQPKQFEIAAKCRECDATNGPKQILAGGGRGSGKTQTILSQIFADDCQRIKGLKVLCLRKVGKANKEQIQDFRKKLLQNLPHEYREQKQEITFANGSTVVLGNYMNERDLDKYLGIEFDLIYIMECNQLTRSKIVNILSCLRTNKTNWRPRAYLDTNPGGISHFEHKQIFVEPWKENRETETRYIHTTVDDNKFVNVEYKQYLESLVGWQREAWLYGSWDFLAGAYFTNFRDDINIFPNKKYDCQRKDIRRFFGAFDYGFQHLSAFLLFAQDTKDNLYVLEEYGEAELTPDVHAENIKSLLRRHNLEPYDLDSIVAGHDCFHRKEEGNTIAQTYAENGLDFLPAENARVNGWQRMLNCFGDPTKGIEPTLFIHFSCTHLITQIKMAQHSEKIAGDVQKFNYVKSDVEAMNESGQEGDDFCDACRMGVFSNTDRGLKFAMPVSLNRTPYQMIGG